MKKYISIILTLILLLTGADAYAFSVNSTSSCVIDADTGYCYYEQNADEPLAPASMTKVMTVYIIYKNIADGKISKDTLITADAEDALASRDPEATNVTLEEGWSYSVEELIGAILVPSACAACEMIGKHISGSERKFAELMTSTAQKMGLTAYYEDASGLSDANRITARSMVKLASALINEYPDVLNYTAQPYIMFAGKKYNSTNNMLTGKAYEYWGTDGLKTGTTTLAGCCFTATAVHDGIRLISTTMHSASGYDRFADSKQLLDYGFDCAYPMHYGVLATDMRIFINGKEMPAFCCRGKLSCIIEDLNDYGFDVEWDKQTSTVLAAHRSDKELTPIPMEMYRAYEKGTEIFHIEPYEGLNAQIDYKYTLHKLNDICFVGGYTVISADELGAIADSCTWNDAERYLDITFDTAE